MTDKYLIMIEQPWVANGLKLATSKIKGSTFFDCLEWCPEQKNVFHIIDKESGDSITKVKHSSRFQGSV
jgi:carotenoid cleavage dioxygenase-like enzyme